MANQQVTELYYRLETIKSLIFYSPPPLNGEEGLFHYSLDNDKLIVRLKQYCSTEEEARHLVENFLRSWEINDALEHGIKRINFKYENAKIIDLDNHNAVIVPGRSGWLLGGSSNLISPEPYYPKPPAFFRISPGVLDLWEGYERFLNNPDSLQPMAYSCLTFLEKQAGNRKEAAKKYQIEDDILDKIGKFTSEYKSYGKTVRKFKSGISPTPLTISEIEWLKAAVRAIIRRVGEINNTPSLHVIKMSDLPTI